MSPRYALEWGIQRRNIGDHVDNRNSITSALPASKVLIWELGLLVTVPFSLFLTDIRACLPTLANGDLREIPLGG